MDVTTGQQTTLKAVLSAAHERRIDVVSKAFAAAAADEAALDILQRAEAATRWAEDAEKALRADILHRLWSYTIKSTSPDAPATLAGPYNRIQLRMGFNSGNLPPYTELHSNSAQRCAVDGMGCPTSLPPRGPIPIPEVLAAESAAINHVTALWKEREAAVAAAEAVDNPAWGCAALPGVLTHLRDLRLRCRTGLLRRDAAVWRTAADGSATPVQPLHVALGAHGIALPPPPQGGGSDQVLPPPLVWSPEASWSEASQQAPPPAVAAVASVQAVVVPNAQPAGSIPGAAHPLAAARPAAVEVTAQEVNSATRSPATASPGVLPSATPVAVDAGAESANTDVTPPLSAEVDEDAGQEPSGGHPPVQPPQCDSPSVADPPPADDAPAPDASPAAAEAAAAPIAESVPETQLAVEEPQAEAVPVRDAAAAEAPATHEMARVDDGSDDDSDDMPFAAPESADLAWHNVGGILRMAEEANEFVTAAVASAHATPVPKSAPPCASGAAETCARELQMQDAPGAAAALPTQDGVPHTQVFDTAPAEEPAAAAPQRANASAAAAAVAQPSDQAAATVHPAPLPVVPAPKRRGRPPGSVNKKKVAAVSVEPAAATVEVPHRAAEAPPPPPLSEPPAPPPAVDDPMDTTAPPPPPVADVLGPEVTAVLSAVDAVEAPPAPVAAPAFTDEPLNRDMFDLMVPAGSPLTPPSGFLLPELEQLLASLTSPLPMLAPGAVPPQRLSYGLSLALPPHTLTPGRDTTPEPASKRRRPVPAVPPPPVPLESVKGVRLGLCADDAQRQCPLTAASPGHSLWLVLACADRALTADEVVMAAQQRGTGGGCHELQSALNRIFCDSGLQQHFARVALPEEPHVAYVAVVAGAPGDVTVSAPSCSESPLPSGISERSLVGSIWRALDVAGPSGATVDWILQRMQQAGMGSAVSAATLTREIHASQDDGAGLFVGLGRGIFTLARHAGVTATAAPLCARSNPFHGKAQPRSSLKGTCSPGAAPEPVAVAAPAAPCVASATAPSPMFEVKRSGIQGLGVFAARPIARGERVVEYLGELITMSEADVREAKYQKQRLADYMFTLDRRRDGNHIVIDATHKGNVARLINHSCGPNCESRFESDGAGKKHIFIHALRDIPTGEELCYDYCFDKETDPAKRLPCRCGAAKCTGWMA